MSPPEPLSTNRSSPSPCGKGSGDLTESAHKRVRTTRSQTTALLKKLIFKPSGRAMSPTHIRRAYRYSVDQAVINGERPMVLSIGFCAEIERMVVDQFCTLLRYPKIIVETWSGEEMHADPAEAKVRDALFSFDTV